MSDKDGKPLAQGSGFLVSKDGLVVTNYHVIAEGSSAVVKLPDGAFYVVDGVVASDKARDVAVIKARGQNFRTLTLGNSERVQVGEEVVARVLVMGDEVRTEENFFRRTITINSFTGRSLSARLQGSLRLLPFPLPASPSVPSCDGLSPCEERYGLTLFR
jgi:S1-C subfamily serine protease